MLGTVGGAVIVIPFHKDALCPEERMSLRRCHDVFCRYRRVLAIPERVDPALFLAEDPGLEVERFANKWFASAVGYNLLCRWPGFYGRFSIHEYMMLYQLDSYVFVDRLADWCRRGYDYVGAPWPNYEHMTESRKRIARLPFLKRLLTRAGQGGFSLRRIGPMRRASRLLYPISLLLKRFPEDVFWTSVGCRLYPLRVAGFDASLDFSFDASPALCYKLNDNKLPFGCHGWYTHGAEFWSRWIQARQEEAG